MTFQKITESSETLNVPSEIQNDFFMINQRILDAYQTNTVNSAYFEQLQNMLAAAVKEYREGDYDNLYEVLEDNKYFWDTINGGKRLKTNKARVTEESASSLGRFYTKYDNLDYALDEARRIFPEGGYVIIALPTEQFIVVDFAGGKNTIERAKATKGCRIVKEVPSHPTNSTVFNLQKLAKVCTSRTVIEVNLNGISRGKIKSEGNKINADDLWVSNINLSDDESGESALEYYNNFPITLIEPISQNTLKVWL